MIRRVLMVLVCCSVVSRAGKVIYATYDSPLLQTQVAYLVVVGNSYARDVAAGKRCAVLYLLHCAGCDHKTWLQSGYGNVDGYIDSVNFIAAAPYGGLSWWLDSPKLPPSAYSRFLVEEFKPLIDSLYATLSDRNNTGVAGWSMGGFGALHNLIKHPNVFGAAFSIKGGFDATLPLNPHWGGDFGLYAVLGSGPADTANWNAVNILKNAWRLKGQRATIGFYSGLHDAWFAEENRRLDTILTREGIAHLFYEADETHFDVPDSQMRKIMRFFDSVFTHTAAAAAPNCRRAMPTGRSHAADAGCVDAFGRTAQRRRGPSALRILPPAAGARRRIFIEE